VTSSDNDGGYWSLDIPGLTREKAERLLRSVEDLGLEYGASTVDPTRFLVLILDEGSIRGLAEALRASASETTSQTGSASTRLVVDGLLEDCDKWLDANARADGRD
jgi:hypothetical protein